MTVPDYYNVAFVWHIVGSTTAATLQVVPVVTAAAMNGTASAQIQGLGFEEGNGSIYSFAGATLVDSSSAAGPDVIYDYANGSDVSNGLVNLPPPTSGAGSLTVTTAGGTSAPFAWDAIDPNLGDLSDVAVNPTGEPPCTSPSTTATVIQRSIPAPAGRDRLGDRPARRQLVRPDRPAGRPAGDDLAQHVGAVWAACWWSTATPTPTALTPSTPPPCPP